jgi:hypothetical protein
MKTCHLPKLLAATLVVALAFASGCSTCCKSNQSSSNSKSSGEIEGHVLIAGQPVAGSTVTLYAAGEGAPTKLAQGKTDAQGEFEMDAKSAPQDSVVYLVAEGPKDGVALMSLLGTSWPEKVTVNELTTVASAFCAAQFINGEAVSGKPLSLDIAAGNVPNFVNLKTGGWGEVLINPLNSSMTTTMATFDTLGSLISAYATVANDDWRARFVKAATPPVGVAPKNTIEAMADIARVSYAAPKELYGLFDEAYPLPAPDGRRSAPFVPYLVWAPDDFALSLCFSGGGAYSTGRFMFDANGNLWSGMNWLPGSQSGVNKSTGGGVGKFAPNGAALSPAITGFSGMGIDGVGWGTAVAKDKVWITSFNGKILVLNFDGTPAATENDVPFKEKLLGLMGIGIANNGDVWIADGSDNQLLFFPGGVLKNGKIVKVEGLVSPFDIVIDDQNRVWVANSSSDTVVRFPADDPSKVETFHCSIGVRALALDSKGNVWVANNMDLKTPVPKIPANASIMEQFKFVTDAMFKYIMTPPGHITGQVNMIRPDGTQPDPMGYTGPGESIPWGINVDGNDDVWVGNMWGRCATLLAGDNTAGHPPGTKAGDTLHIFQSGSIQMVTDVSIDPAGNVWVANNWNSLDAAASPDPKRPTSTWGGGSGFTVIYGVASPVQSPRIGKVRKM